MANYSVQINARQVMDGVTRYQVLVSDGAQSWIACKRYNEIEALHNGMRYAMPNLPPMPQKSFWRKSFSEDFRQDRQQRIQGLLQAMVARDPQLTMPQLRQFFQVPNGAVGQAQVSPAPPMQMQGALQSQQALQASAPVYAQPAGAYATPGQAAAYTQPAYTQPVVAQARAAPVQAQATPVYAQQPAPMQPAPVYAQQQVPLYQQPAPVFTQQPVYAQQPVYTQQPVYAQPAMPAYGAQPVYGASPCYQQPMHHDRHNGMGMAVGAGVGGLAAGVIGGMMVEHAIEGERHRELGFGGGFGGIGGGFGGIGGGFGGFEDREVRSDMFGDREVRDVRTDMFGNTEVRDVRTDMFGDRTETDVRTDMFGNTEVITEREDMFGDVTYTQDDFVSDW